MILLILALLQISYAFNNQCSSATLVDLTTMNEFSVTEDTTQSTLSSYRVGRKMIKQKGKWYRIHTNGLGNNIEIDTCLSGTTNFDSKIIVFGGCSRGIGTQLLSMNDDSFTGCGSAARLIFNDKRKTTFFVFITGSDVNDVGIFGLRINKLPATSNKECKYAQEINQYPTYREATTTGIAPNYKGLSGLFYTIKGNGDRIHISTCHRATNVDTIINVFDNCELMNPISVQTRVCDNKNMGSKIFIDTQPGKVYNVHVSSTPKKRGMFIVAFETENTIVPQTCEKSTAITSLPFSSTTKLDGNTLSMSCGNTQQKVGAWYSIVGDGYDYILYTCNSMNGPQDGTMIEIFESCNSNSQCVMNDNGCGLHGKISKKLEMNKNYFIKVSCTNPHTQCRVTLNVEKLNTQGDINSCIIAKTVEITSRTDSFTDSFDITTARTSETKCGGVKPRKGLWYKVVNNYKYAFPLFIQTNVLLASSTKHTAEIQMYRSCTLECEERQLSVQHLTLKPKETVMFFITTDETEGQLGIFIREDHRLQHDTCKTALEFNAPFTLVEYKPNTGRTTNPVCAANLVGKHTGIYYYFQSPVTDTMVVETCGLETQFDTYVEVFQGCGNDASCVLSNDDSPECGSSASYVKFEAQQGAEYYIYVSEASKAIDTEGTFRLNVYTLNPPSHSTCQRAELLTPGLTQYALTKYAIESVSTCSKDISHNIDSLTFGRFERKKGTQNHLKGVWYKYSSTVKGKLHINTCNAATSVRTRMGVYRSCSAVNDINIPDQCIVEHTVSYQSCSTRGTYVSVDLNRGETVFIFVGGETAKDVGFVAVDSEFQTEAPEYVPIVYTPRVGPKRIKERRTLWILWAFWWFVYALVCVMAFGALKYFGSNDDFLGYHEL
ncbi:bacterial pre-peptidase domain containing protein [Entamoeba histolytica HM-3:IMSS]|nr:bacterial prepeptidase-terminal domain containing protein [Entamoeba histolytica KU27]EMS17621.1 bacterial pre-peptidase domain containing protein [Entamoeba histolytica HM-3:IMSS]ENY63867.1 bacterial pre-peptidase c-terminal domain containing protein [Entamoeba histolytica HM-1:IMSS-A]BAJ53816.1 cysteine protease binding protein family 3 [Entamoeba histolytica]GAT99315.1 hypothetical protein CL6EHI_161650 [Entamoeba histolytica]